MITVVILSWTWSGDDALPSERLADYRVDESATDAAISPTGVGKPEPQATQALGLSADDGGIPHDLVIGNPDCRMSVGSGSGSGVALVAVPEADGAAFEVLGESGRLFADSLPFAPNHLSVSRRSDGVVLAGLGDLRLNSSVFRDPDTLEPLRIYADGQVIYDVDKAWDFSIAADGSSFFVHEPLAGDASRLVIHDLDLGVIKEYDLGTTYTPASAYEIGFAARYSLGFGEVIFAPAYADAFGRDVHRFYPVGGRAVRQATGALSNSAHFASSEIGFFADFVDVSPVHMDSTPRVPEEVWRLSRRALDHESGGSAVDVWTRDVSLQGFYGTMELSDEGDWLAVKAWNLTILDAATGEVVFEYPLAGDKEAERRRIANVMGSNMALEQVGDVSSVGFRDKRLLLYRRIGSEIGCSGIRGRDYAECLADLRRAGLFRSVVDVYDMASIELEGQPDFRLQTDPSIQCGSGYALRGLEVSGGSLRYRYVPVATSGGM